MSIWIWVDRYSAKVREDRRISLGEGGTPCIRSRVIGPSLGLDQLYFKVEGSNPTGSYKDRFAALAVSRMLERGDHTCLATSSGNTGAALAAYCAAAGLRCRIAVVESAPTGKLQQMMAYGAEVIRVRGFGLDAGITTAVFDRLNALGQKPGHALQISAYAYSPEGMEGVESIAFELVEEFDEGWDSVFCPVGGGGLALATSRGFAKSGDQSPAIHCVQPAGNDTVASALRNGEAKGREVECSTSISGLQVASVIDGDEVISKCRETGGTGHLVGDEEVWEMQRLLAREEGVFSEPAGAVALAGLAKAVKKGDVNRAQRIVCLVTGSGFKDPESVQRINADRACPIVEATDLFV